MGTSIGITLEVVCGKWKGLILWKLLHVESIRFNELKRAVDGDISSRILSRELNKLIEDGLVERIDFQEVPPKVAYKMTEYGQTTEVFLRSMNKWGLEHKKLSVSRSEMADLVKEDHDPFN
ncbi:helix-turn-helix domain-containing protein [Thalassobacillus sp. CUG 92003]|uniref:winged helix-turn-helix transcriptional regulator n=1 Tax=Thalassobacillus sp. CUG 92003 TaxID=2736641 RepID=UPI0015E7ACCC